MPSDKEIEEVAKEIWHTAQSECKYTVDPTRDECRLLAKAALGASERVRNEWQPIETAPHGKAVLTNEGTAVYADHYGGGGKSWALCDLDGHAALCVENGVFDLEPTHWLDVLTNTNDTSETVSNENKDNVS